MTQWMTQFLQSRLPTIPRSDESILQHVVRRSMGDEPEVEREADVESSGSFESASANTLDEVAKPSSYKLVVLKNVYLFLMVQLTDEIILYEFNSN